MLTRCLFALLSLAALVILFSPAPGVVPPSEPLLRKSLLAGMWILGIGMAVPWGCWMRLVSPGRNLAFVSKLLGWGGASEIPFFLVSRDWLATGVGVLLPVCAFALWKGRIWSAWAWYAVGLGAFGISVASAIYAFLVPIWIGPLDPDMEAAGAIITYLMVGIWVLFWGGIGLVLTREVTAWRRRLRADPGSTAAG